MEMNSMMARNWRNLKRPRGVVMVEESGHYGKYVIEPLERGYGYTLGESLERLLMSSIRGAAVTSFHIDGLSDHGEIYGVEEDLEHLKLQLKALALWGVCDQPMTVECKLDKGEVFARDLKLPEGFKLASPDLKLCTVTNKSVTLKLELRNGYGYVPAEQHEGVAKGFFPLDAFFSPVKRVSYQVTDARIGQRTDYNKLTLKVETNGVLSPQEAIIHSAQLFRSQMSTFINFKEDEEVIEVEEVAEERPAYYDMLDTPISDLSLPARAENCLRNAKIHYLGELVQRTERNISDLKNFGRKSLADIQNALSDRKLSLGMVIDDWEPPAGSVEGH